MGYFALTYMYNMRLNDIYLKPMLTEWASTYTHLHRVGMRNERIRIGLRIYIDNITDILKDGPRNFSNMV